jgi:hypothetical protein
MQQTRQEFREAPYRDPDELEREADAARESIRQTIDSLEQRLSPGQMVDRMFRQWREGNSEFTTNLTRTVRANPVPVLLSALGLTWLALADKRPPPPAGSYASSGSGGSTSGAMRSTREAFGSARERASSAAASMTDQSARARERFSRMQTEQPFLLGALGLALGAALGGVMPRTRTEEEVIGRYADSAREAIREAGERTMETSSSGSTGADPMREGPGATGTTGRPHGTTPPGSPGSPYSR